jgi:hypothetical protein
MDSNNEIFKKRIDKAFGKLPKVSSETMLDAEKYKGMMKETDTSEIEEKWTEKYKKSIDCKNPKGFSQKAHCQGRKKENKEATTTSSSGPVIGKVAFDPDSEFVKKSFAETPGVKKMETKEATGSGSSGSYETPAAWAKSTSKKDWRGKSKPLYKGGSFVSVKKKCKKFPYCNQGDINALHIFQNENLKEAIKNVSEKLNLNENTIKAILDYEFEKLQKNK